ncbi:phosphohistidine phosphatase SixA [Thalassotalea marina]|nr:phosphohistidine phosphatase SixA [Thalassotalea marina]
MQLYVMRHGQASNSASSDAQRQLTEQGFLEAKVMAKWAKEQKLCFDRVIVSPFIRAQQTAQAFIKELDQVVEMQTVSFITPEGQANEVHDYIDGICQLEKLSSVLIVSHMPLVSYLVAEMTFEHNAPIFPTAGIAHIDYDLQRMKGDLKSFTSPYDLC